MSLVEYKGVKITFNNRSIHIDKSYKITDDVFKKEIIKVLFDLSPTLADYRTPKDMFTEWKAHNILFQHKYQQARTKDVDFEYEPTLIHRIGFKLIVLLLREKQ